MAENSAEPTTQIVTIGPPADSPAAAHREVPLTPQTATVLALSPGHPVGERCPLCCHWILPVSGAREDQILTMDGRSGTQFAVALRYHEWIAYHLHIITHQQLDRQMQVLVA